MNILVMNLEKLLEPLFLLFICRLDILWDRGSVNDAHSDLFLAHGVMARFSTTYNEELSQQCCPAVVASFSKSLINKPQIYLIYYLNWKQKLQHCAREDPRVILKASAVSAFQGRPSSWSVGRVVATATCKYLVR